MVALRGPALSLQPGPLCILTFAERIGDSTSSSATQSSGAIVWRKGGAQKKQCFWALVRRNFSRHAIASTKRMTLELMSCFLQWLYWRSAAPETYALAGRRVTPPSPDLLTALGCLRRRLRETVGDDLWAKHGDDFPDALESFRFAR